MRAVWLPLVEDERKRLPEDNAAPVQGVPAIAEGGTRGPSLNAVVRTDGKGTEELLALMLAGDSIGGDHG